VFGADGRAYLPWRSSLRNNRVYAYYVPQRGMAEGAAGTALPRCPALELESVVIEHLRGQMRAPIPVIEQLPASFRQDPLFSLDAACAALKDLDAAWELFFAQIQRTLLVRMIDRVTISAESISIRLDPDGIAQVLLDLLGWRSGKRSSWTRARGRIPWCDPNVRYSVRHSRTKQFEKFGVPYQGAS
jgi:site-specific DNA recombinase